MRGYYKAQEQAAQALLRGGWLMTISSNAGITGQFFCSAYAAGKFGVEGWMGLRRIDDMASCDQALNQADAGLQAISLCQQCACSSGAHAYDPQG